MAEIWRSLLNHFLKSPTGHPLASRLIIHWREPQPYDALWTVRGLDPNGKYYGELVASSVPNCHNATEKAGTSITGKLLQSEADAVFQAAHSIAPTAKSLTGELRMGLLATGPYSNPKLIYEHFLTAASVSSSQNFCIVIDTFKPYFTAHLNDLLVAVRDPTWPNIDSPKSE